MERKRYATDLTDAEWRILEPVAATCFIDIMAIVLRSRRLFAVDAGSRHHRVREGAVMRQAVPYALILVLEIGLELLFVRTAPIKVA